MIHRAGKKTTLVHNEQMKLYATFCNNLSVASVVAGLIVPMFGGPGSPLLYLATGPTLSFLLHFLGHFAIAHMREEKMESGAEA